MRYAKNVNEGFMKLGTYLIIILISLFLFIQCSDNHKKIGIEEEKVRIEFSNCTACYDCIEKFNCPQHAIIIDETTGIPIIDSDKCIQCMRCMTQFSCSYNAITTETDEIPPGSITNFVAVSDTIGILQITFTAPGDDEMQGLAHHYELSLTDTLGNDLNSSFTIPNPKFAGQIENWVINDLPENIICNISLQAFDEENHFSPEVTKEIAISGNNLDEIPPSPITDLTAISQENSILLQWSAPSDDESRGSVVSYDIRYYSEIVSEQNWENTSIIDNDIIPTSNGEAESFEIDFLPIQNEFYFAIRSFDEANNHSTISNSVSAMITGDITAPATITDLQVVENSVSMNSMQLSWTATGDNDTNGTASFYEIKISISEITEENYNEIDSIEQSIVPQEAGYQENFFVTGLSPLTTYFFAIKAYDEVNNSSLLSNIASASTNEEIDNIPPAAITDLTVSAAEDGFHLQWTAVGDDNLTGTAYSYQIAFSNETINENNWQSSTFISDTISPSQSGTIENFFYSTDVFGVEFYFAIKVTDEVSNTSPISNVVVAMIPIDDIAPAQISDLSAEVEGSNVVLSWTAVGDDGIDGTADYYEICYFTNEISDSNWDQCTFVVNTITPNQSGSEESFSINDLEMDILYFFAVRAVDDNENISDISNNAVAIIENDSIAPNAINDLMVISGNAINNSTIQIQWSAPGDDGLEGNADHYEIRYSQTEISDSNWNDATIFYNPPSPTNPGTTQTCNITNLQEGVRFHFAIKTYDDSNNESEISNCPSGKIVYMINTAQCMDCNRCINDCDQHAIYDAGPYKAINPDLCIGCGDCVYECPWGLISLEVYAY